MFAILGASCSGNASAVGGQVADSTVEETIEETYDSFGNSVDSDAVVIDESVGNSLTAQQRADKKLIRNFFVNCVFGYVDNQYADKVCTPALLQRLKHEYTKAGYDGDGYAMWIFRTEAQDGDGDSNVLDITPAEDGWYQVDYIDMGLLGTTMVQVENGLIAGCSR